MQGFFGFLAFLAFVLFIVTMIKPNSKVIFWTQKKTRGMGCLYLVATIIFGIIAGNAGGSAANTVNTASSSPAQSQAASSTATVSKATPSTAPASSAAPAAKPYSTTLMSGYYEVGTDIPAGKYDFEIASGAGNVVDVGDGVNLMMGKDSSYQKSYKNATLTDGNTLILMQCSIKIASKEASTNLKKRDNSSAKAITLSSGKYVAGKDFQPGYYDITLVSGSGNVICGDNELNAMMGSDTSMYVKEYKNVPFKVDYTLDLEGPKVKLTPSK